MIKTVYEVVPVNERGMSQAGENPIIFDDKENALIYGEAMLGTYYAIGERHVAEIDGKQYLLVSTTPVSYTSASQAYNKISKQLYDKLSPAEKILIKRHNAYDPDDK